VFQVSRNIQFSYFWITPAPLFLASSALCVFFLGRITQPARNAQMELLIKEHTPCLRASNEVVHTNSDRRVGGKRRKQFNQLNWIGATPILVLMAGWRPVVSCHECVQSALELEWHPLTHGSFSSYYQNPLHMNLNFPGICCYWMHMPLLFLIWWIQCYWLSAESVHWQTQTRTKSQNWLSAGSFSQVIRP